MDIRISHSCPACGAPIEMKEGDRLCSCGFCDMQSYIVANELLRFVLPDKIPDHIDNRDIVYFPYMRFKGAVFTCRGNTIIAKMLDTTFQCIDERIAAPSLGLRPQAMPVSFVDQRLAGRFLRRRESEPKLFQRAALMSEAFSNPGGDPPYHRAFIGETVSCVYLPLYIENGMVYDGTVNKRLGAAGSWLTQEINWLRFREEWQPAFLATHCPQCGAAMQGESDALVMHCYNCESCCGEKNGKFVPVPYRIVSSAKKDTVYLPFWRIALEARGLNMRSLADLLTVTNQPVVVNSRHKEKNLELWVPAMKLRPKIFLSLAKNATLSQLKFPEGEKKMARPLSPVTLPLTEALQALKCVVAEITVHRKEVLPKLPILNFVVKQTSLMFLPFEDTGHDLVQYHSALSVPASVVKAGRNL